MFFAEGLSPFQRVSKAVVSIMGQPRYTALRQVMLIGKRSTGDVKTACTNGRDEVYGNKFVESLTDAELRFLILHETRHKLYRHLHVWRHLYEATMRSTCRSRTRIATAMRPCLCVTASPLV
jgi:hypothetical protein